MDNSHTILGEYGTATWCGYCKYAHGALKALFIGGWHDFYYISLVDDKNKNAEDRIDEIGITGFPTVWWDGNYVNNIGAGSIPGAMTAYNSSIASCGSRTVADIDVDISVTWQGSATMSITVTVDNNEASYYSGYLRCYVTEIESSMGWYDTGGYLYTFPFLDYAFDQSISAPAGGSWSDTVSWNGANYNDGYGNNFGQITEDNTYIIASVFASQYGYVDESDGVMVGDNEAPYSPSEPDPEDEEINVSVNPTLSWEGGDPQWFDSVYYDIYLEEGDPTPDILVSEDQTTTSYNPNTLEFDTTYYWQIVAEDNNGATSYGPVWSFTTRGNDPPNEPSDPDPEDGETDVYINTDLSWTGGDPDGDDVTYDVYFGTNNPPPKAVNNQSGTSYNPPGVIDFDTTYYWKIIAWDVFNYSSTGSIWSFTTETNTPPNEPSDPDPEDGATDVSIDDILKWTGGDPNPGDTVTYDVYFGTSSPPPMVVEDLIQTAYDPGTMDLNTMYYWQIVARDSQDLSTTGPIWHFTTELEQNQPPNEPSIDGLTSGKAGEEYDYTFSVIDPNDDVVYYYIEWGDGNIEDWIGSYDSGEEVIISHSWDEQKTYTIRAKAKDSHDAESDWTTLEVTMPKNKPFIQNFPLLNWLFERFPNMFPIIRHLLAL
jgi:glutaredoxin